MSTPAACLLLLFAVESGHAATPVNEVVSPPAQAPTKAPTKESAFARETADAAAVREAGPTTAVTGGAGGGSAGAPAGRAAPVVAPVTLPQMLAHIDALHRRRDEPAVLAEEKKLVNETLARARGDFEVLWRAARFYFWLSDDPGMASEQRSKLGKLGWDLAERAIVANPSQAAGYYWAAVTMGNYALGLGVVKALTEGMEDKFKTRLGRAEQLAADYQFGGVDVAWGRFYEKLPWPKRDRKKAELHLRRALTRANGVNLRARVYLADTLAHDDRAAEAKKLLDDVAAAPVGRYDAPEERRAKALGVGLTPAVLKMLK